jgi:uncharacterized iron-regulated protein
MRALFVAVLAFFVCFLAGCAAAPRQAVQPTPDPRFVPAFRGTGEPTSWPELVSAAREADVVIIGENHGHPVGLPFAAALWQDVLAESPDAALSLEFFERDEQSRLDEYLLGVVDEPTFRKRTGRTNSNYPPAHREMVEAAKAAGRPVIASNAPRPMVRLARTDGFERLETLTPEQRRMFRRPDALPDGRYRDDFFKLMSRNSAGHGEEPKATSDEEAAAAETIRVDSMFRSQSLWDWTMAESIARTYDDGHRPIFHIVGRFHSDHDGGLVQALRRIRPEARVLVISVVDERADALKEADQGRGDFVVYVGPHSRAGK